MRPHRARSSNRPAWALRVAAATLLATAALAPVPAAASGPVGTFIQGLADEALNQLSPDNISQEEREKRFRQLLRANFDLQRIARFVLGHHARQAGPDQMHEFMALYEDLMTLTYARLFAQYSGETFAVKRVTESEGGRYAMVMSEVRLPSDKDTVALDWQVLTEGDRHAVVDLRVEGVSLAVTQRDEFGAVLDRHNGDIGALLDNLRSRIAKLKEHR